MGNTSHLGSTCSVLCSKPAPEFALLDNLFNHSRDKSGKGVNIGKQLDGVMSAAPDILRLDGEYSIKEFMPGVLSALFQAAKDGIPVARAVAQKDMFSEIPPIVADTAMMLDEFRNSPDRIAQCFREYARLAKLQFAAGETLFEMDTVTPSTIMREAKRKASEGLRQRNSLEAMPSADEIAEAKRQYDEVVARYTNPDGTKNPGWMMAPNGKPTNLTERQWVMVRTPNFKRWFGDWENDPENASKVLDENGEPLVVYHGERYGYSLRTVFLPSQALNPNNTQSAGIYFTQDEEYAKGFKGEVGAFFLNIRDIYEGSRRDIEDELEDVDTGIYGIDDLLEKFPLYLEVVKNKIVKSVQDALDIYTDEELVNDLGVDADHLDEFKSIALEPDDWDWYNFLEYEHEHRAYLGKPINDALDELSEEMQLDTRPFKFRVYLESKGYDGQVAPISGYNGDQYIVFSPAQIKSATENIGTYDGRNDDTRYSVESMASQEDAIELEKNQEVPPGNDGYGHATLDRKRSVSARRYSLKFVNRLSNAPERVKKIKVNFDKAISNWGKRGFTANSAFRAIARLLGMHENLSAKNSHKTKKSHYKTLINNAGVPFEIRIGDHGANAKSFKFNTMIDTSIVFLYDEHTFAGLKNKQRYGHPIEQYAYNLKDIADKATVLEIVKCFRSMLDTGIYVDSTGKAKYDCSGDIDSARREIYQKLGQADVGIYVRDTGAYFVDKIFSKDANSRKTVDTRTEKAWAKIEKTLLKFRPDGNFKGMRIAVISNGIVHGYVTIEDIVHYSSADEFHADKSRHHVPEGSEFDYDAENGMVGIVLSKPQKIAPYTIAKAKTSPDLASSSNVNRNSWEVSPAEDAEYLDAVKRGDMDTAQRMVNEAAKRVGAFKRNAGESTYLHVPSAINEKTGEIVDFVQLMLDKIKGGETRSLDAPKLPVGKWLGLEEYGLVYGKVKFGNPIVITNKSPEYQNARIDGTIFGLKDGESKLYYPVTDIVDMRDNPRPRIPKRNSATYGTYQEKLPDPVTYDDNGNIIPLSQRFNLKRDDVRYSFAVMESANNDARNSIVLAPDVKERQNEYYDKYYIRNENDAHSPVNRRDLPREVLNRGQDMIDVMVGIMKPYLSKTKNGLRYLPEENYGESTIFANGSYGKTIENSLICWRTLSYIDFTDAVKRRLGRPLTAKESFLASQMLYEIATEPQCLYCYVSLDRKAYDEFLLKYMNQRQEVLDKYSAMPEKSKDAVNNLYTEFLAGRKNTRNMRDRFDSWIRIAEIGNAIGMAEMTTREIRSGVKARDIDAQIAARWNEAQTKAEALHGKEKRAYMRSREYLNAFIDYAATSRGQVEDAEKYAQGASWAKKTVDYNSYTGEILKATRDAFDKIMAHYGLRFY